MSLEGLTAQKQLNQEGPFSKDLGEWPDKAAKSRTATQPKMDFT